MSQIQMKPGSFVVFEGLDATGKSTQMLRLQHAAKGELAEGQELFTERPIFTHQPSGNDELGRAIYALTEAYDINNAWTRQFLHLASHANHYQNLIIPALEMGRSVFMDRCWWSTFAYGYFGGIMLDVFSNSIVAPEEFLTIAQLPTQGRLPDLVLLFLEPYGEDKHNTPAVTSGYEWLETYHADKGLCPVKTIYGGTLEQISLEVIIALCDAGLADPVG